MRCLKSDEESFADQVGHVIGVGATPN
jgi:hypothetical protein